MVGHQRHVNGRLHRLRRVFGLCWEELACAVLLTTALIFVLSPGLHTRLEELVTQGSPTNIASLQFLLSSIAQGEAVLFGLVATVLTLVSQSAARYRLPLSYWTMGSRGWARVGLMAISLFLPLVLLQFGGLELSPWALALFALSVVVLFFFAMDQLRKAKLDNFLLFAFKRRTALPPHWLPYLRDMASVALRARDYEDLSKIVPVLANVSADGRQGLSVLNYIAPLAQQVNDLEQQSQMSLLMQSLLSFSDPLSRPSFPQHAEAQEAVWETLMSEGGTTARELVRRAKNPFFTANLDSVPWDFDCFVILLEQTLGLPLAFNAARMPAVGTTLSQVLLGYYVWDMAEGRNEPSFSEPGKSQHEWPASLVLVLQRVPLACCHSLGESRYVFEQCLQHLESVLTLHGEWGKAISEEIRMLKGRAWNRLVFDCQRQALGPTAEQGSYLVSFDEVGKALVLEAAGLP
jgi:hypothetical protein